MKKMVFVLFILVCVASMPYPAIAGEIHDAVKGGDINKVKALLDKHPEYINLRETGKEAAPLPTAIASKNKEIALLLIERGADVNGTYGIYTNLSLASALGWKDIAETLIGKGAVINVQDPKLRNPLHCAIQYRKFDVAEYLVNKGADVNLKDGDIQAVPLHYARDPKTTAFLLDRGADVDAKTAGGITPLYAGLADNAPIENVRLLVERGADVNVKDKDGRTPLFLAAFHNKTNMVKYLLEKGAQVNTRDNRGNTPLFEATSAYFGDQESLPTIAALLEKGADPNALNNDGDASLHMAALMDKQSVVKELISKGATIDMKNKKGETPLYLAVREGKVAAAKVLLENGANATTALEDGVTPLHHAAMKGNVVMVELLLSHKASVNAKDKSGKTPLQYAEDLGDKGKAAAEMLKKKSEVK